MPRLIRQASLVIAAGSLAVLAYTVLNTETYFVNPGNIFSYYVVPLCLAIVAGCFALLPTNLGLSLAITLVLIGSIEGVFYFLNKNPGDPVTTQHDPEFQHPDEKLGYTGIPGTETRAFKKQGEETIYDVTYSLDEFGRRVAPGQTIKSENNYVLFFGGSFTFGEGLENSETLPAWLAHNSENITTYNYGHPGYGPQHVLTLLQESDIRNQIQESNGMLIYPLISTHVQRAIGSMIVYSTWGYSMPYYYVDTDGSLKRDRNFTAGRPLRSMFYSLIGRSQLFKYLGLDLPFNVSEQNYRLTATIIGAAKSAYEEQFGNENFYVLIWPGATSGKELIPYLEKQGIRYLNYFSRIDFGEEKYQIQGDGHPSSYAQQALAQFIAEDIDRLELVESTE